MRSGKLHVCTDERFQREIQFRVFRIFNGKNKPINSGQIVNPLGLPNQTPQSKRLCR